MVVQSSQIKLKDLGVTLDPDIAFDERVKNISRAAFFHLRNIAKIRNFLSKFDAEKLIHAFVTSRLDYCNALLSGYPDEALNKLIKCDHITPVLALYAGFLLLRLGMISRFYC